MKLTKFINAFLFVFSVFLITNCSKNLNYRYHNLHLSKDISIDDLKQMNYEIGSVMRQHTSKYADEVEFNDKTYEQLDDKNKLAIIGTLKKEMQGKFYNDMQPNNKKTMSINFLTNTKTYKKQRICHRTRSCGRRCTERFDEPCMKHNYDVITNVIGTDKDDKSSVLFKYKIKYHEEREHYRYEKNLSTFDEILEYQVKQFVEDLVKENDD